MDVLGIESTAHTLGIGIFNDKKGVLSNARARYQPKGGGILPRDAADHHALNFPLVLKSSLETANIDIGDIDAIAVAQGPKNTQQDPAHRENHQQHEHDDGQGDRQAERAAWRHGDSVGNKER